MRINEEYKIKINFNSKVNDKLKFDDKRSPNPTAYLAGYPVDKIHFKNKAKYFPYIPNLLGESPRTLSLTLSYSVGSDSVFLIKVGGKPALNGSYNKNFCFIKKFENYLSLNKVVPLTFLGYLNTTAALLLDNIVLDEDELIKEEYVQQLRSLAIRFRDVVRTNLTNFWTSRFDDSYIKLANLNTLKSIDLNYNKKLAEKCIDNFFSIYKLNFNTQLDEDYYKKFFLYDFIDTSVSRVIIYNIDFRKGQIITKTQKRSSTKKAVLLNKKSTREVFNFRFPLYNDERNLEFKHLVLSYLKIIIATQHKVVSNNLNNYKKNFCTNFNSEFDAV